MTAQEFITQKVLTFADWMFWVNKLSCSKKPEASMLILALFKAMKENTEWKTKYEQMKAHIEAKKQNIIAITNKPAAND